MESLIMDLQSMLGYAENSPFRNAPYLDIQTPEGLITMENTPVDLLGIDNLGNVKRMKAKSKNPYKFAGTQVREIPMQAGGFSSKQLFDFLFDDEDEEKPKEKPATAPTTEDVDIQTQMSELEAMKKQLQDQQDENLAMSIATQSRRNPYAFQPKNITGNPYTGDILSSGQFGDQNIGEYGREIYGNLATDLGYAPVANSIFRSKAQNNALIAAGKPAVSNSWHLSGNAVDLKPTDWHRLSDQQQLFYRSNYDVVYHDNHYHIEPKK
jgi:hypothetical protein